jgi:valyl-tRNA synthetase
MPPMEMIGLYSADAVRYWAASTGLGKDAIISEEKIQLGAKLVTKLWNVARFSERFLEGYWPTGIAPALSPADRWILSRTQRLIRRATGLWENYDYAAAKSETEAFFWRDLADNYLEMAKLRLYDENDPGREGARFALYHVLLAVIKFFAPILPHVTEEIYQGLFAATQGEASIHRSAWPVPDESLEDAAAEGAGEALVDIATAVRRYKSEQNLSLGTKLERLQLATRVPAMAEALQGAVGDLASITRAQRVEVGSNLDPNLEEIQRDGVVWVALKR